MGLAIGLALLVGIIATASSKARAAPAPAAASATSAPPTVDDHAAKIVASGDPRKMVAAAVAMKKAGDHARAAEMAAHAQLAAQKQSMASRNVVYPSPFTAVPTERWSSWVHALRGDNPRQVTPANNVGLWAMSMRRLVDIGLATNPRQETRNGRKVWVADWVEPLQPGPETFLADPELQYQAFVKSVNDDMAAIKRELPNAVGQDVDGVKATPSGLLAVSKIAGLQGLKDWLSSAEKRKTHTTTTALFKKLNGVF